MLRRIAPLLIALVLFPALASSHSLYIQSGRYLVSEGKQSPLFFCYGHHIPVDDAVRRKKLASVRFMDPQGQSKDITLRDEKSLHSYLVDYSMPGTYVLTAETTPGFFTMWTDKKDRKRHAIKPMSALKDRAKSIESSLRSSQWTKTYVVCETASPDFPAHVGLPLELVPQRDPATVKKGEVLKMRVYKDGKPFEGEGFWDATYNGFSTEAEDMYHPRTAVTDGVITMPVEHTGRWFVRFYSKTPPPEQFRDDCLLEKRTATMVFEVPNERRRPKNDSH